MDEREDLLKKPAKSWLEILQELRKLEKAEIKSIIQQLLIGEEIDYAEISQLYVFYLEHKKKLALSKESMFASLLGWSLQKVNKKDLSFFHSRCSVLLRPWVPKTFIEEYCKEKNKKQIDDCLKTLEV
ncbi:MAG TPA: hypothetical protein ENG37_01940 [Firmicutes bacterium]|nr:hypothetical protein [Bacillota bacterium]